MLRFALPWLLLAFLRVCGLPLRLRQSGALNEVVRDQAVERREQRRAARPVPDGPGSLAPWVAGTEGSLRHIVLGASRMDVDGDRVVPAGDRTAGPLVAAVRVPDGWVFASGDGAIVRADGFLGPLRLLCAAPQGFTYPRSSEGRLVVRDPYGVWWSTDGRGPLTRLGDPLVVAFGSPAFGAAVRDGGALQVTTDGGRTWRPMDLGTTAAWTVEGDHAGLWVWTSAGRERLTPREHRVVLDAPSTSGPDAMFPGNSALQALALQPATVLPSPLSPGRYPLPPAAPRHPSDPLVVAVCGRGHKTDAPLGPAGLALGVLLSSSSTAAVGPVRASVPTMPLNGVFNVAWRSVDGRGFMVGTWVAPLPALVPDGLAGSGANRIAEVLVATREGIALRGEGQDDWQWLSHGSPGAVVVAEAIAPVRRLGHSGRSITALALPDGGFVRLSTRDVRPWDGDDPTVVMPRELDQGWLDVVEVWDAHGSLRTRRAVTWPMVGDINALGRFRGRWGLVTAVRGDPHAVRFTSVEGGEPEDLPRMDTGPLGVCVGTTPTDAVTVLLTGTAARGRLDLGYLPDALDGLRIEVEVTPSGTCLRRMTAVRRGSNAVPETWWLEARAGTRLVGVADDGSIQRTVSCETLVGPRGRAE